MNYLSVCSGIEAATVAWHPLGWTPAAFAEIEPFPSAVLAHHYPHVPNLGDMTKYADWPDYPISLLVGGTPCQSFSVAGLRKGLRDPRGNLMLTFGAIASRYRPRWLVWENVPGVLSSNGGRDFGTFLGMLGELGYGFAYRVLDAQYFGLAQRRARVFVVGHLGDWRRAAAVLLERNSLSGNPPPGREARQEAAGTLSACTSRGGGLGSGGPAGDECQNLIAHSLRGEGFDASEDGTGRGTPLVPVAFHGSQDPCVSGSITHPVGRNNGLETCVAFQTRIARNGRGQPSEVVPALNGSDAGETSDMRPCVATQFAVRRLTPRECERLQGFPDDWTMVPFRGKPACDGPRYRALGNSMAVPVMRWIGERIAMVDAITASEER